MINQFYLLMAKNIKNIQLGSDNRSCVIAHQRSNRHYDHNHRLLELEQCRLFLKFPNFSIHPPKPIRKYTNNNQPPIYQQQDERLILISSFKHIQNQPLFNYKNFRVQKSKLKKIVSNEDYSNRKRNTETETETESQVNLMESETVENMYDKGMQALEGIQSNQQTSIYLNEKIQPFDVFRAKRIVMSGNREHLKPNIKSCADRGLKKKTKLGQIDSKIKLAQMKQKKYPMLFKGEEDLREIKSQSYVIIQYPSQKLILSHKAQTPLEIASLTKIMTFYTTIKIASTFEIDIQTHSIRVSSQVNKITGTSAQLIEGQQYTIQQLLYGLMLPSGNDAANQLAFWGGNLIQPNSDHQIQLKVFVNEMNKNAKHLQLKNTKFGNPHGLPHQQARSTASDIAKLCLSCMKINIFTQIVKCKQYQVFIKDVGYQRTVQWENTNKLLRRQGFIGLKTGITVTAGPCLAAAYNLRGNTYISVILRARKVSSRFKETRLVLHWALSRLFRDLDEREKAVLRSLKRRNEDLDSDNSEDQHQFKYDNSDNSQLKKRNKILSNEL